MNAEGGVAAAHHTFHLTPHRTLQHNHYTYRYDDGYVLNAEVVMLWQPSVLAVSGRFGGGDDGCNGGGTDLREVVHGSRVWQKVTIGRDGASTG
ncbi:hypothetical protein L1987_09242 [Smallanthus sonchifolius]|uniref:Uncharacterized protein n=1 Tax=Smallanthus sonchifolius TaxID=185202 RepID=A0ACB9JPE5_9ASTR|nr:hypothetical protein L1987_09242 [Smallanthus sonchifolius]